MGAPKLPTLWRLYGITPTENHPSPKRQMPDMTNSEHVLGTFIRKMCRTVARSQVWTLIPIACGYVTNRMDLPRFQRPGRSQRASRNVFKDKINLMESRAIKTNSLNALKTIRKRWKCKEGRSDI